MTVLIAIPAYNEEGVLRRTVETLCRFVYGAMRDHDTTIVIVDNRSTDGTECIGRELAAADPRVRYLRLEERGKGRAVRAAWMSQDADAYVFMDADLSTDLRALPAAVAAIAEGAQLAIGSRRVPGAVAERSMTRRAFSTGYRAVLGACFATAVTDAPCGFKAVSSDVVRKILPEVRDDRWFFDTELVLRAERRGMCIAEIPVIWRDWRREGRRSRVRVLPLAAEYLRSVWRLRRELG
jgi:glycosyltransferase involved in cell wall biosynthesis